MKQTITWKCRCYFCDRSITRGKPTILFATDKPLLIGISHSTCASTKYRYGHHQMCPPDSLSSEQVSFLIQFFPKLYALPGWDKPNADLRRCVADLLWDYPKSMIDPIAHLEEFREQNRNKPWSYKGDLEVDFLRFLGQVRKLSREDPVHIEFDFP